jgi:cobalt-zinc-cadmium efflux system protein
MRGAFLHMLADMGVSVGVVVGRRHRADRLVWLDPAMSLIVSVVIVWGPGSAARCRQDVAGGSANIDPMQVRAYLESVSGVEASHDLHIWAMSTTETALTCHLVMPKEHPGDAFLAQRCHELRIASASGTSRSRSSLATPARANWRRSRHIDRPAYRGLSKRSGI